MEANIRSLQTKEPTSPILNRYAEIGEWLIGKRLETEQETRDAGIKFVRKLCLRLQGSLPQHWVNFHKIFLLENMNSNNGCTSSMIR
jgi:hypothetical protein